MQQAESSRDTVQRRENSCLRDAFVFSLWHTSRRQTIAVIGGQCRSRADNLQRDTVEAGRVQLGPIVENIIQAFLHPSPNFTGGGEKLRNVASILDHNRT